MRPKIFIYAVYHNDIKLTKWSTSRESLIELCYSFKVMMSEIGHHMSSVYIKTNTLILEDMGFTQ